jgi:hypothetical protein
MMISKFRFGNLRSAFVVSASSSVLAFLKVVIDVAIESLKLIGRISLTILQVFLAISILLYGCAYFACLGLMKTIAVCFFPGHDSSRFRIDYPH